MNDVRDIARWLRDTWDDHLLSRGERRAIGAWIADDTTASEREARVAATRAAAFALARDLVASEPARAGQVLAWLEDVVKAMAAASLGSASAVAAPTAAGASEAWFAPHGDVMARICRAFEAARVSADVCVFTITDDRITRVVLDAHRRGVRIRIVSDNDKSVDVGSDIERLAEADIAVRMDRTPAHMHHKFAIFDGAVLLNGSYNWTRSAGLENHENLVVSSEPGLVAAFAAEFEHVWGKAEPVHHIAVVTTRAMR